jgi:amino acid transporter
MRGNTVAQMSLYGGTTLQPLSKEGYISNKFNELNSNHFPAQAMKLNVIVVAITIGVWMFIPDIINGATGGKADFINVNTIISAASSFYILIYLFVLLAILKYAFEHAIKTNIVERVLYMVVALLLCVIFVYHYYDVISAVPSSYHDWKNGNGTQDQFITNVVALVVEIVFMLAVAGFVSLTYIFYYQPKLRKRLETNKDHQINLDRQFRLMDG